MSIKPILFNTDMVRSILDGRKTVTRRIVKQSVCESFERGRRRVISFFNEKRNIMESPLYKAPYQLGDILYVRETWQCWRAHRYEATADIMFRAGGDGVQIQFANGNTDYACREDYDKFVKKWFSYYGEWRPSIHMPKDAARIWLKVTDVRVERLQEITECQIVAEGTPYDQEEYDQLKRGEVVAHHAETYLRGCFMDLWNSTIKKVDADRYGWAANPWVWVIEFEPEEKPEVDDA